MRPLYVSLSVLLFACDGGLNGKSTGSTDAGGLAADNDGDGYTAEDDCDDNDAAIHPGAVESCNGTDDNCDGVIDEESGSAWYRDSDGDGYGDAQEEVASCSAPDGHVQDATDCDDGDATVYPDAAELCDGVDNNCDNSTRDEEETVTLWVAGGEGIDLTDEMSGRSSSPAVHTLSTPGELVFCEGSYHVNLTVTAEVAISSFSGDPEDVTLDGAGEASVIDIQAEDADISISGLTLQDGAGSAYVTGEETPAGGAVSCGTLSDDVTLEIDNVIFQENTATYGGAVVGYDCDISITDTEIINNSAEIGGGVVILGGELEMLDVVISENRATDDVGGVWVFDNSGNGASADLEDVTFEGNEADDVISVLAASAAAVTIHGDSAVIGNVDNFSALYTDAGGSIELDGVNMGAADSGDDNSPHDVGTYAGLPYRYDGETSVACDDSGCGTESTETISSADRAGGWEANARGTVWEATENGTIETMSWYISTEDGDGCDLTFYVASAADTTDASWAIEWSGSQSITSSTDSWVETDIIGVPVEIGRFYAGIIAWDCSGYSDELDYYYDYSDSSAGDLGMGTSVGIWQVNDYEEWTDRSTSTTLYSGEDGSRRGYTTDETRYHHTVTWSH